MLATRATNSAITGDLASTIVRVLYHADPTWQVRTAWLIMRIVINAVSTGAVLAFKHHDLIGVRCARKHAEV